ncbi:MAG: F0F1 ATP synthase subunit delta [Pseudomonadota bacterium]
MSELATIARPYAEAVFKRAKETNTASAWSDMLAFIAAVMQDDEVAAASENPRVGKDRFTGLFLSICEGRLNDEGINFVRLLIENDRLKLAKYISQLFEIRKAEDEGYVDVELKTAYPFSNEDEQEVSSMLERTLSKKVRLRIEVDNALIGGFVARAGDKVIDGSVSGQLKKLARRL